MTPVFVLNLDRDTDRLAWMQGELGRVGLPFERLPGVLGSEVPSHIRPYLAAAMEHPDNTLRPGEFGCWASHLAALQTIVDRDLPYALIFEDDVEIGPGLLSVLSMIDQLPAGWGMVRLAWTSKRHSVPVTELAPGATLVKFSRLPLGAAAYLVSREGAINVLKSPDLGHVPIDLAWRSWWTYDLQTYGVSPAPVRQNIFDQSSIEALGGRPGNFVHDRHTLRAFARNRVNRMRGLRAQVGFLGVRDWVRCAVHNVTGTANGSISPRR